MPCSVSTNTSLDHSRSAISCRVTSCPSREASKISNSIGFWSPPPSRLLRSSSNPPQSRRNSRNSYTNPRSVLGTGFGTPPPPPQVLHGALGKGPIAETLVLHHNFTSTFTPSSLPPPSPDG